MRVHWLLAFVLLAPQARALTRVWPTGPAPCNAIANLQACVDAAASGDVIEIAANAIPAQSVNIPQSFTPPKSLTLRPAAGFTPVFADFTTIFAAGGDVNVTIVIEGLTIQRGFIGARQGGEGTFDVTLRRNRILNTSTFRSALEVSSSNTQPPYGPTLFRIEENEIDINVAPTDQVSAITVGGFQGGTNVGRVSGNVIRQFGGDQNGAIDIANGNAALEVDVIGNRISGANFNEGVGIFQFGNGKTSARVINNLISGQVDDAGVPGAISLNVSGGDASFTVLDNTAAYNERGLLLNGRPDLGASASALIANNIFAFNSVQGFSISDFEATTINEHNIVFGNGSNFFTPGPGTLLADPLFVSPTNLRLRSGSPARDAGNNARVPADITTDVVGNARIRDGVVDIGAYEDGDDYLLLNNPCSGSAEHLPVALTDLGLSFVETSTPAAFGAALASGTSWDLVLADVYNDSLPADVRSAILAYIGDGGRIYMNSWTWDAALAAGFGATLGTSIDPPPVLDVWDPSHPVLSDPEAVGNASPVLDTCGVDAWRFEPQAGARALAGYTAAPAANEAGLIVGNAGRTILLGITPGLYPAAQMLPLLRNAIRFLLAPDILLLDAQCGTGPQSRSHFPEALGDLDLAYVHTTEGSRFDAWLTSGKDWRLVIVDSYSQSPGSPAALQTYVKNGGRAWWNGWNTDPVTADVFGAALGAVLPAPLPVQRWHGACCGPDHPVYREPGLDGVQQPELDTCGIDGFELGLLGEGVALAGYTTVPEGGKAALIAGNRGRTLIFGGTPGLYPASEMVPLLRGSLRFLLSGYPLYTTENFGSVLRAIDPETGRTLSGVGIELAGSPIGGAPGLAVDPLSGKLWAATAGQGGRDLVRVDPDSGVATPVGPLGEQFAGLAFDCGGNLFGVTGDGNPGAPESLFAIDTSDASTTLLSALGAGDSGEALAFSPADGLLYHGSGRTDQAFESIDDGLAITPIALSGDAFSEFRGLTYAERGRLLLSDGFALFDLSTAGVAGLRGPLDHFAKGLANTNVRCCADPDDADCDGRPNAVDLCPFYMENDPSADVDGNGRGDECECGDQTGDGKVDVSDLVAINVAIFNPGQVTPLCDANGDGRCNVNDIVSANVEIFSPGNTSTCGRQPVPGP